MRTVESSAWWRRARERRARQLPAAEARLRGSFRAAMREYWAHCSLLRTSRLPRGRLPKLDRYSGAAVCAACACVAGWWVCAQWAVQASAPALQLLPAAEQHAIQRIPFPAVALCSTATITNTALHNYTDFLWRRSRNGTYSVRKIRENLLKFGHLLTLASPPLDTTFLQFLTRTDPAFNVTRLMYQLSPPCSELVVRCSWRGRVVDCRRLFAARVTPLGFCCVFNSRYLAEDADRTPRYLDSVGRDFGLDVVTYENPDNFAFRRRPDIGVEVLLFDGDNYPLIEGGGVRLYPAGRNSSTLLRLQARELWGACARAGEAHARCLTRCRARTLAALCACRAYTLPPDLARAHPLCSLEHLACLNKHREKLIYYLPDGYTAEPALQEEVQNSQDCECAPDCSRRRYSASLAICSYEYIRRVKIFANRFTKGRGNLVNTSRITLFYTSEHQGVYRVEVACRWYETLVRVCSEWWVLGGVPALALAELLFHCTLRWAHHYRRHRPPPPPAATARHR